MSFASLSTIIFLYASAALASVVAINLVPIYAKSAPNALHAKIPAPSVIAPESAIGPLKNLLTSLTKAKGFRVPACPPAPAPTKIRPSTPASIAFLACLIEITS